MPRTDATATQSPDQASLAAQNMVLQILMDMSVGDAIGAACSFLLHCAYNHRVEFRRVMNEKVVREGFTGISLLEVFKRVSQ
jgi:hypothetical protein